MLGPRSGATASLSSQMYCRHESANLQEAQEEEITVFSILLKKLDKLLNLFQSIEEKLQKKNYL